MSRLRICLLTHYYPPEVGAPQMRLASLARGLSEQGHHVTVHTGFPNYPRGRVIAPYRNRLVRHELIDGIRVVRSVVLPTENRGFARRLLNHTAFAAGAVALQALAGRQDVVVAESPPLFLAAAAPPYARRAGARLVLHVADLWPESAVAVGALGASPLVGAAQRLARWCYRHADAIAVPTVGMVRRLEADPAAAGGVHRVVPHVDETRFAGAPPAARSGPLEVLYAGTVGLAHGIRTLLDAAELLGPAAASDATRRGLENVRFLGTVTPAAVADLYEHAEAGLVLLRDDPLFADALPTKLLECMAAARPAVVSAPGEAAELVRAAGAGVAVAPEDPRALAAALAGLRRRRGELAGMGARGRRLVLERFGRRRTLESWERVLAATRSRHGGT